MKLYQLFILLLILVSCDSPPTPVQELPVAVRVIYPKAGKQDITIVASGMIANSEESSLSFKSGGMVEQVNVEEGQYVQKGVLLARLNVTELDAQLQQGNLNISKLKRDESRLAQLVKDTTATFEQLQNVQTSLSTALEQKRGLEYNRQQAFLYAPSAGFILKRSINPGEYKSPGSPVFVLSSNATNNKWIFKISVSDKDRMQLKIGQQTTISLDALNGTSFTGHIIKLSDIPDEQSNTYDCYVSFNPGTANVVYGLTGKLSITYESADTYTNLPLEALMAAEGKDAIIYTLTADNIVERKAVHIHHINSQTVSLEETLPAGTAVIIAGKTDARPGSKVRVIQ